MTTDFEVTTTLKELAIETIKPDPNNPRKGTLQVDDLVTSIKQVGLVEPIVVRKVGGGYVVIAGHRRFAACKKLKWATIPSVIVTGHDDSSALGSAVAENTVREPLSAADEAGAMVKLVGLGWTDEEIAGAFARDAKSVAAAKTIGEATEKGTAALTNFKSGEDVQLTLEQAAAVAQFGGTSAGKQLMIEIRSGSRYWRATYEKLIRKERVDNEAKEITAKHKGVKKASSFSNSWNGPPAEIEPLVNLTDAKGKQLTAANHKSCPGHAYNIEKPDAWGSATKCKVDYWCLDWKANGHKVSKTPKRTWGKRGDVQQPMRHGLNTPKVDEATVAIERALDEAWADGSARRKVFVEEFVNKPKTGDGWAVTALRLAIRNVGEDQLEEVAEAWDKLNAKTLVQAIIRAYVVDCEGNLEDWRWQRWYQGRHVDYLNFLVSVGYELSEGEKTAIERAVAGTAYVTHRSESVTVLDDEEVNEDSDLDELDEDGES